MNNPLTTHDLVVMESSFLTGSYLPPCACDTTVNLGVEQLLAKYKMERWRANMLSEQNGYGKDW